MGAWHGSNRPLHCAWITCVFDIDWLDVDKCTAVVLVTNLTSVTPHARVRCARCVGAYTGPSGTSSFTIFVIV